MISICMGGSDQDMVILIMMAMSSDVLLVNDNLLEYLAKL
jgi:hypothetical protein